MGYILKLKICELRGLLADLKDFFEVISRIKFWYFKLLNEELMCILRVERLSCEVWEVFWEFLRQVRLH